MKTKSLSLFCIVALVAAAAGWSLALAANENPSRKEESVRWEYKIVNAGVFEKKPLNEAGGEGWELVAVVAGEGGGFYAYYFKRAVRNG